MMAGNTFDDISSTFRYRALSTAVEQTGKGIVIFDRDRNLVFDNTVALEWLHHGTPTISWADVEDAARSALEGRASTRTMDFLGAQRSAVEMCGVPILDENQEADGAVVMLDDVSVRRHFEDRRRAFIANVSHELKTPVGALSLLAETLLIETDPEVIERLVNHMHAEAMRVATVIDDLLSLSRIESGPVQFEELNARALVDQAVNRVRVAADHAHNLLTVQGDTRATIYGDHRDIVSALQHLLENALKYSGDGSSVEVDIRSVGLFTEIGVTDYGIGIDQKYVERIFERFYRVDDARTRATGGTGLGLSIVRHVVLAHGGDIRVTSQQGEGSTFTVRFAATSSVGTKQIAAEGGTDG